MNYINVNHLVQFDDVSGMMCTLGDVSVTGVTLGGGFVSEVGQLRPLQRNEQVLGATGANVAGGWCGTVIWIGGTTTLGDEAFVEDGVGTVALLVLNISVSWRSANSWASLMVVKDVLGWRGFSAAVRSLAASIEALTEDVAGTAYTYGKHLTILVIRSAQVLGMYTLYYL